MSDIKVLVEEEEAIDVTTKIENDFIKGEKGDPNTLTIGTVQKGEEAFASIIGDSPNQILNLILPKGDKGDRGEQGIQGEKGEPGDVSLKQITTEQTTDIAEDLTITECAGVNGKLDIKDGKTIQEGTPTPNTPIDIRNVGDNINLIDITTLLASYVGSNGNFYDSSSSGEKRSDFIKVDPNTEYTFKIHETSQSNNDWIGIGEYSSNNTSTFIQRDVKSNASFTKGCEYTITTTATTQYIVVSARNLVGATKIKLEKGKVSTEHSEYGCGSVGFKVENDNKFNKNTTTDGKYVNANGGLESQATAMVSDYIEIKTNTDHYISGRNTWASIGLYDENKVFLERLATTKPNGIVNISNSNCKYIRINALLTDKDTLQLVEGNIEKPYVEHQEQTVVFPLSEGQLLHKGDYLVEDGIHQARKTYVFTGEETFVMYTTGTTNIFRTSMFSSELKLVNDKAIVLCNYAKGVSNSEWTKYATENIVFGGSNGLIQFILPNITTLDDFKSYLAEQYANGTPVTVEYELAEEKVTPYTEEQKEAYYRLQHLLMYEGYTSIECIEEIKPDIQVTYLYNNEINKTFGKKIDELSSEVHELKKQVADLTAMVLSI